MKQKDAEHVPPAMQAAIDQNTELKQTLQQSQLPVRFKAMVLGLATLHSMNPDNTKRN